LRNSHRKRRYHATHFSTISSHTQIPITSQVEKDTQVILTKAYEQDKDKKSKKKATDKTKPKKDTQEKVDIAEVKTTTFSHAALF